MNRTSSGPDNPFVTRRTRPGAIPYQFGPDESVERLVSRLAEQRGWGEIIGPHGSGKSTLLQSLIGALEQQGRRVELVRVAPGTRRLRLATDEWGPATQLIIDGFEQLGWLERWRIRLRCRWAGVGLLVTAHQPTGLPPLFRTRTSPELAEAIVAQLVSPDCTIISSDDVRAALERQQGNLRETLFELYDLYEARRRERERGA